MLVTIAKGDWQMLLPLLTMADFIAIYVLLADVIANIWLWQML